MALRATPVMRQGSPPELMYGLLRWSKSARAQAPNVAVAQGQASEANLAKKAFQHWRNADTGRWNPPQYSLRRQAQLVRAAHETGMLDAVVASPKYARFARRLEEMPTHEVFTGFPTITWPTLSSREDAQEADRIARTFHAHGPYAGRATSRMFKGKKGDRVKHARRRRVEENMRTMHETIDEWRKVCTSIDLFSRKKRQPGRRPSPSLPCRQIDLPRIWIPAHLCHQASQPCIPKDGYPRAPPAPQRSG